MYSCPDRETDPMIGKTIADIKPPVYIRPPAGTPWDLKPSYISETSGTLAERLNIGAPSHVVGVAGYGRISRAPVSRATDRPRTT